MSESVAANIEQQSTSKVFLPLHRATLQVSENGKMCQKPALHKYWIQKREWMHFLPLTRFQSNHAAASGKDQWMTICSEMIQDIEWLLSLPHNCFWSQLVYDPCARVALLSYLELAPRCYDKQLTTLDPEQSNMLAKLHSSVFKVYMRIATIKESEECYLAEDNYSSLLYDNFLLDVPTMLDLCLLYGHTSPTELFNFLNTAVRLQPQYTEDLNSAAHMFVKALKEIEIYFVTQERVDGENVRLRDQAPGSTGELSEARLEDLTSFLLDIVAAMSSLCQLLPSVGTIMHPSMIDIEIGHFYENVIPEMNRNIIIVEDDDKCQELQNKINAARYYLLQIAKATLGTRVAVILENSYQDETTMMAEEYLSVLAECLSDPHFIRDFHILCPIDQDLDILHQKCPQQLDTDKYDFLLESVFSCYEAPKRPQQHEINEARALNAAEKAASWKKMADEAEASTSQTNGHETTPEIQVLEALVSEIQEMLPDLGAGFLQKCLQHFNFNKESVIDAILEESLPKELQTLDRTMPLPVGPDEAAGPSVPVRLNVFDHDEFDIMSRDNIDTSRVHKGKRKSKHRNLSQLLDDNSELKGLREVYNQYSTVQEALYDDEYDDTYDEINVPVDEPEPERRPFVVPRILAQQSGVREEEEEVYEEEEEAPEQKNYENFVQDPAVLRAQAEQRRAAKYGQSYQPRQPKDVVGKPKGHGQDNSVVQNRRHKDANKSSQANHNRRAGAQRKMRQGMVPS